MTIAGVFLSAFFAVFLSTSAGAQEITPYPICTQIINEADYAVRGTLSTARGETPEGEPILHSSNFRLLPGERQDICSSGPFYEGQRLELTLRTVIPVFECRTALTASIIIESAIMDNGERKTWASCY
jgi:hypothetical protein